MSFEAPQFQINKHANIGKVVRAYYPYWYLLDDDIDGSKLPNNYIYKTKLQNNIKKELKSCLFFQYFFFNNWSLFLNVSTINCTVNFLESNNSGLDDIKP